MDSETRIVVQQRTEEIKTLMRRTAQDIIDIGQKLTDVKARLKHGNFGLWLDAEFGWTSMTAQRFMQVANKFKNNNLLDLDIAPSALYLLAAPSTPEEARNEALERAEQGEPITYGKAKEIVEEFQSTASQSGRELDRVLHRKSWTIGQFSTDKHSKARSDRVHP